MNDPTVLESLVSPLGVESFLRDYWPERHAVVHGPVDRLPGPLRDEALRDVSALAARYQRSLSVQRGRVSPTQADLPRGNAAQLYEMGLTVYFHDVIDCIPGAAEMIAALEGELGLQSGVTAMGVFASPEEEGLDIHYDPADVISIQLVGKKRWLLAPITEAPYPVGVQYTPGTAARDVLYPQMTGGFPQAAPDRLETVELGPGSVLFLPRGTWHRTEADGESLSVSLILSEPPALQAVLDHLRWVLLQDSAWRRPLYGATGNAGQRTEAAARAARLLADLPDKVAEISARDLIVSMTDADDRLALADESTAFQRNPGTAGEPVINHVGKPAIKVSNRDRDHAAVAELELNDELMPMVGWINEQVGPFTTEEVVRRFPGFPAGLVLELLQALCRTQLLRMLWYRPLARAPVRPCR